MRTAINRFRRSLAMRGVSGTIAMCVASFREVINPEARRLETQRQNADAAFDEKWNMDTGGIFRPSESEVRGENWHFGIRYQAVDATALEETLQQLAIRHSDFTFVDFGSGKGRAVFIASRFPFKKVIGVEYCAELNRIAQQNLSRLPNNFYQCDAIEFIHADAAEFAIPTGPLVLFFFNPFGRPVMERVVKNVADSFRGNPRRIMVIYFTPYEADLWSATGIFKRQQESPAIFETNAG